MAQPRRNDFLIPTLGVLFDAVAIECSFLVSYYLRFNTHLLDFLPLTDNKPPLDAYVYGSFVVIPIWLLLFQSRKMYGARRNVDPAEEFFHILKLVTLGMLVVMSAAFFYRAFSYSRVVFGLLWITSIIFITIGRVVLYYLEIALYRSGRELRNAVIIGNNETANQIYTSFHNHPLLGFRMIGYFADCPSTGNAPLSGATYLGSLQDVQQKLQTEHVELALIALNHDEHSKLYDLIQDCEGVNVEFMMVPDILELMTSQMHIKEIEGMPFIKIKGVPMTTWGRIMKRSFDVVIALILLALTSPLLSVIMMFIKLDSKGKAFFRQERIGIDGKKFEMIKFRSMNSGAEQSDTQAGLGIQNDPRQTRIGKFLRKTNLDELPQLLNVVKGEMSLVGPRPERTYYVEQFKNLVPKYLDRHRVKTGMTGWAQVNGFRGNSSLEGRIKYDIYYIENWSLWFDIKILLRTVRALLPTKHAY